MNIEKLKKSFEQWNNLGFGKLDLGRNKIISISETFSIFSLLGTI